MVAAICFRLWTAARRSYPMPLPSARFASRSTMRCTPSCFGAFTAALLRCKRSFMLRGYSCWGRGVSAALAAFCAFMVSASSTAARSKSSPNFRAVMLPLWLCPSGRVHTRAWCPGKCSLQNCSPNCCARSTDSPWDFSFPPDFQAEQRRPRPPGSGQAALFRTVLCHGSPTAYGPSRHCGRSR